MSNKNKIYISGALMYLVASCAGLVINHYWLVLIASMLISIYVSNIVFDKNGDREIYNTMKFDWISIFAFAGVELVLTFAISLLSLPLVGLVGYLNLTAQICGYLFIGYAAVRFALDYTEVYSFVKKLLTKRNNNNVVVTPEVKQEITKVEEVIEQETQKEAFETVEDVEEVITEPEVVAIEYKKEEKQVINTPYMEEEI